MTSIADQYRIITSRAGWVDRSARGRIRFAGPDGRSFLQALLSNDVSALEPGRGVYSTWLTPQGRMVTDITVVDRGDALLGLVPEGRGAELATRFDGLIFAESVTVTDVTGGFAEIEVTGTDAADVVAGVTGLDGHAITGLPALGQADFDGGFVLHDGASPFPAFRIFVDAGVGPASGAPRRDRLVAALESSGVVEMSPEMATALRIESGRAKWGHDLTEEIIPLEAGLLDRAISTAKGCYVGQEIVIRILHRGGGRVAKRLVALAFDRGVDDPLPEGTAIEAEGKAVGHLSSVAFSPGQQRVIALGYVHRDVAEIGRQLRAAGSGAGLTITAFAQ